MTPTSNLQPLLSKLLPFSISSRSSQSSAVRNKVRLLAAFPSLLFHSFSMTEYLFSLAHPLQASTKNPSDSRSFSTNPNRKQDLLSPNCSNLTASQASSTETGGL
ncbi:uncharacterized protein [Malus domestica]|uniref:uncharacterized protein isoform X2 n=1 Tax=Malus domestica TaxID=3750 RepID=UPI0010AB05C4|nr:uncharacterized protein LOC103413658 isoform X3 [Malus domestica]